MNLQKKVFIGALCTLLFLMVVYLLLSRNKPHPRIDLASLSPTASPTPTDGPIPTIDPSINENTIFELRPSQVPVDTFDKKLSETLKVDEFTNHPDTVVSNNTPYSTNRFIITTEFVDSEGGYFMVKVSSMVVVDIKQEVHDWLLSLGLTEKAISKLKIVYD